jgi:Tol biopolymer transport system component/DNA-binding winged helix-turn-helix (wHTH) protein
MSSSIRRDSQPSSQRPQRIAFNNFEIDLRSGEVRKSGSRIRLQAQPFQLLVLLLANAGEVVTREEIYRELWPANTFVDFEHSLSAAVNKIRDALGDSADDPKYIETLPKRGYRFVGTIRPEPPVVMAAPDAQKRVELVPVTGTKVAGIRIWLFVPLAGAVVLAIAVFFFRPSHKPGNSRPIKVVQFTSYLGQETVPAISPDGSRIAFSWDSASLQPSGAPAYDLYMKVIGSETLLRLTHQPSEWISSVWSPDGTQIAFMRLAGPDTGIYIVPALGGTVRKLLVTHTPYSLAAPISWSPNGKWIAYSDTANGRPGNTNFLLNMETLEAHELPHDPTCIHEGAPTFSHSGKELAVLCVHSTDNFEFFVADTEGSSKRSVATTHEFPTNIAWGAGDRSLIISRSLAEGPELDEIRVADKSLERIPIAVNGLWASTSPDGKKLAFSSILSQDNIWRRDLLHPDAPALQMYPSTMQQNEAQYSPDGQHVVFDSTRSGTWSVWMADVDGSNLVQISHEQAAGFPRWSPNSRKMVFQMEEPDGSVSVYVADTSDRVPRRLAIPFRRATFPDWSRDGKWIYFRTFESGRQQIYRSPVEGGEPTRVVTSDIVDEPVESLDGKSLFFMPTTGEISIKMLALDHPGAAPKRIPEMPEVYSSQQWTVVPTGIYFTSQSAPRTVCFYDFTTRKTHEVFKADHDFSDGMSVSPDGRYLLYTQMDESNADIMLVNNLR